MPLSHTQILQLRTDRAKKVKDANELLDKARTEKRDMSAEESQRFDTLHSEADKDLTTIEREERAATSALSITEPATKSAPATNTRRGRARIAATVATAVVAGALTAAEARGVDELSDEQREVAEMRNDAMDAWTRGGDSALSPEQRQVINDLNEEYRALTAGTNTAGGYTVAPDTSMYGRIIEKLKAFSLDESLFEVVNTATGAALPIPTNDDTANEGSDAVDENADADDATDFVLGQISIGAYMHSTGMLKVSQQFLQDTSIDTESFIGRKLGERMGRKKARILTVGNGTTQGQGIVTGAGAGITAASVSAISNDELIKLEHSVDRAYRESASCRYMFHDQTLLAFKLLKDTTGRPLWQPGITVGAPDRINNYPYVVNNNMAQIAASAASVVFGDFSQFMVRNVKGFAIQRLVELGAKAGQVWFIGWQRFDSKMLNSSAIKKLAHPAS